MTRVIPGKDCTLPPLPALLPCPFCGGAAALNNVDWVMGRRRVYCACVECRGSGQDIHYCPGPDHGLRDEALYAAVCAWNTRAVAPRPAACGPDA